MQIVIDIPDRIHYAIEKDITVNGSKASQMLIDAVKNGTPLPKNHGKAEMQEKIDKAIEEMNRLADHKIRPISFDQSVAIDMCIDILKKAYRKESEE